MMYKAPNFKKVGWIYSDEMHAQSINKKKGPQYSESLKDMVIDEKYHIEIKEDSVFINDKRIAKAPDNKTPSFKAKFLKAIVWGLIHDKDNIKEKLGLIDDHPVIKQIMGPFTLIGWVNYGAYSIKEEVIA